MDAARTLRKCMDTVPAFKEFLVRRAKPSGPAAGSGAATERHSGRASLPSDTHGGATVSRGIKSSGESDRGGGGV